MSVMFHEGRLPVAAGPGSSDGPEWRTQVLVLSSGREVRNATWAAPRRKWDLVTVPLDMTAAQTVQGFFDARRGRLQGFRYRDPAACSTAAPGAAPSSLDQTIGEGDGEKLSFQLVLGQGASESTICKPVAPSVVIALDGDAMSEGWSVDEATGIILFESPPAHGVVITAGFEFDWPVRFDTDHLEITYSSPGIGQVIRLPLVELRAEDAL